MTMNKRGRPPKKKGRSSWKPASMLTVVDKPEGYRTRWVSKDSLNMQRKKAEGWLMANEINGTEATHEHPDKMGDGRPLTSVKEYRDMVLMVLPEEIAKERDEYFREKTDKQTADLKKNLQDDAEGKGVAGDEAVHGSIIIN